MILAGIDEAGYGPLLGPLVVSAAVFRCRVPDGAPPSKPSPGASVDLWEALSSAVSRRVDGRRVPVADSKKLYPSKKGLADLEEGVLPFLLQRQDELPARLRDLLRQVARRGARGGAAYLDRYPWYESRDLDLPVDAFPAAVRKLAQRLREALAASSVEFLGLAAAPVEVIEFNERLERENNKAAVSFAAVASFLRRLWKQFEGEATEVWIDRQGGRMRYGPNLYRSVRPRGIRILEQTPEISSYELLRPTRAPSASSATAPFTVTFAVDGEEKCLAVALASMLSKYIRELHMKAFNEFWTERLEGLRPTAGYTVDARRFLADTEALRRELHVDDHCLVRRR